MSDKNHELMGFALAEAVKCQLSADVPVGAVIINASGRVIATGHNEREATNDPTGHAEVLAIRVAARVVGSWRLDDCTLVVTLEPCSMCAGAILSARIPRVIFGAWDEKAGAAGSVYDLLRDQRGNHRCEVIAEVRAAESALLLREFFAAKRRN